MKLYKEASLMMLPTSVKDGKLYSIFPQPKPLSGELVTNGEFDTDSDWSKGTGCTISDGKAKFTSAASGQGFTQSNFLTIGKIYKVAFTVSDYSEGAVKVRYPFNMSNTITANGSYVEYGEATTDDLFFQNVGTSTLSIDNVSVVEVDQAPADFDFSRGADRATRVTEQGLVRPVEIVSDELVQNGDFEEIGDELVTNGGFDTDSDWSFNPSFGVTIENGVAKFDNVNAYSQLLQHNVFTSGKTYKISFSIRNYSGGSLAVQETPNVNPAIFTTGSIDDGDHDITVYYRATTTSGITFKVVTPAESVSLELDNISVKEVGQNWSVSNEDSTHFVEFSEEGARFVSDTTTPILTLNQDISLTAGTTYKFSIKLKNNGGTGNIKIQATGLDFIPDILDGTYTQYVTPAQNQSLISFYRNGANTDLYIEDFSIVEVTEATDLPRLDWSGDCPVLLLEPQRTNLVTYSEDFSQWSLGTGGISIDTGYLAPDGSNNATKVTMDSNFSNTALTLNIGLGTTETRTIYARTVSGTGQANLCSFNGNTDNLFTITEEWQRFEVNGAISTGAVNFYAIDFRGNTNLNEIIIWGAQAEQGSYATSYIPTRGQAATRAYDRFDNTDLGDYIGTGDATFFFDFDFDVVAREGSNMLYRVYSGTDSFGIKGTSTSNRNLQLRADSGFVNDVNISSAANTSHKIIARVTGDVVEVFYNGTKLTDTMTGFSTYSWSELRVNAQTSFLGKTKEITVFDTALSDNECINLTSI